MPAHTSDLTLCLKTFYLRSRCFTGNVAKGLCRRVTRGRFSVVREHTALLFVHLCFCYTVLRDIVPFNRLSSLKEYVIECDVRRNECQKNRFLLPPVVGVSVLYCGVPLAGYSRLTQENVTQMRTWPAAHRHCSIHYIQFHREFCTNRSVYICHIGMLM